QTVCADTQPRKIEGMQTRHQPCRPKSCLAVHRVDRAQLCRRRVVGRQWRPQSLDPATLLIDENERVGPSRVFPHGAYQVAHLVRIADVAGKKYEAPAPLTANEGCLFAV